MARNVTVDENGRRHLRHSDERRTCYRCNKNKPNEAFTWRRNGTPFSACKECNVIMARERREKKRAEAAAKAAKEGK
jgi:hypothetical protein